mmetsp:Transcript_168429/g.323691  ORF Transcript_168429/g.323691 Transcript_168429/m.323691 type:complete len:262 (+) Transcript_168429:103-888(+)
MADEDEGPKYTLRVPGSDEPREGGSKMYTGHGKALYPNEDTYDGTFVEGYRRGKGIYVHKKNGDCYEGHYEENKKHGFGKMTYSSKYGDEEEDAGDEPKPLRGGTFLGYYTAGRRGCGEREQVDDKSDGTFTYANGDIYVGQWKADKKHGRGAYSYAKDGTKLVGEWEKGRIISGKWIFPNGTLYSGTFKNNKPDGKGVWVFKNGNQLTGEYKQKEKEEAEPPPEGDEAGEVEDKLKKVWCYFTHGKDVCVRGGQMARPKA